MAMGVSVFLLFLFLLLVASWVQTSWAEKEKFVEFSFFMHDDLRVANATAFFAVPPLEGIPEDFPSTGKPLLGGVVVMDDPLTKGPNPASTKIGKAKGLYVWDGLVGAPALEFVFPAVLNNKSGFTPDSTLSYRGHDYIRTKVREIAIVGGTGDFRLARGWAQLSVTKVVNYTAVFNFTNSVYYGGYES